MYANTDYHIIAEVINILLHFSTIYLCELGFSTLKNIKNKKPGVAFSIDQEIRVCLSSIRLCIELLSLKRQAQVSH